MSGPNIPEAQRKTVAVKLRLSPGTAALLASLCPEGDRSWYVTALIKQAAKRAGKGAK